MNVTILMGSPRRPSNTAELCKPFMDELQQQGCEVRYITLADRHIEPCRGCYHCQNVSGEYGCCIGDDMAELAADMLWADCIVLATPIYAWYCTASMKAVLDRHYGFNKYYGSAQGCLWQGKHLATLLTHGYDADYATAPFVTGIERLCEHSQLKFAGSYSVQDTDDLASFQTNDAKNGAKAFARELIRRAAE